MRARPVAQPMGNPELAYDTSLCQIDSLVSSDDDESNRTVSVGHPVKSNKPSAIHPPEMAW
jgi:hypothetical protein